MVVVGVVCGWSRKSNEHDQSPVATMIFGDKQIETGHHMSSTVDKQDLSPSLDHYVEASSQGWSQGLCVYSHRVLT